MTNPAPTRPTTAFYVQSAVSFGIALVTVTIGILYLPLDNWVQAFLALGVLYTVSSAFTLAKCVRDMQESSTVVSRVDQARLDKLLAEHDPFRVESS